MHRKIIAGLAIVASSGPALAQDTTEKLGIAAALGLTAASGKTTLSEGAGSIEAALLGSGAVDEAGHIIAGVARTYAGDRKILVVARDERVDLITAQIVRDRIAMLQSSLDAAIRAAAKAEEDRLRAAQAARRKQSNKEGKSKVEDFADKGTEKGEATEIAGKASIKPRLTDIPAALASDVAISSIELPFNDKLLIQATVMNGYSAPLAAGPAWIEHKWATQNSSTSPFVIPGEIASGQGNPTIAAYMNLMETIDRQRANPDPEVKSIVAATDTYLQAIATKPEDGGPSPLGLAIQLDVVSVKATGGKTDSPAGRSDDRSTKPPYILRVVAEQAGGTSMVSSNIWYTIGFPGAATVGAGLFTSFRLVDPATGSSVVAGMVRCVVRRLKVRSIEKMVLPDPGPEAGKNSRVLCAYRATAAARPEITRPEPNDQRQ